MTQDPTRLGRIAAILLWVWFATDLLLALASLEQIGALGGFAAPIADQATLARSDTINVAAGVIYMIAFTATGVVVLRWVYVTNRNAHALSEAMTVSPGWNVGWFFIPVANLWKPFQGVRETWQATADPADPAAVPVPARLRWWWGCWIATTLIGNLSFRLTMRADTPSELIAANWLYVLPIPIDLVLLLALVPHIRDLSRRQAERLAAAPAEV